MTTERTWIAIVFSVLLVACDFTGDERAPDGGCEVELDASGPADARDLDAAIDAEIVDAEVVEVDAMDCIYRPDPDAGVVACSDCCAVSCDDEGVCWCSNVEPRIYCEP